MNNVYKKIAKARVEFQNKNLKKNGKNKYANFSYFELSDIRPIANSIFNELGLLDKFDLLEDKATLTIFNCDDKEDSIVFQFATNINEVEAKMGHDKQSQGMQPVQRLGSVTTYLERYLLCKALGISDGDVIDALEPNKEPKTDSKPKTTTAVDLARQQLIEVVQKQNLDINQVATKFKLNKNSTAKEYTDAIAAIIEVK